jgi:hypothetical protein
MPLYSERINIDQANSFLLLNSSAEAYEQFAIEAI